METTHLNGKSHVIPATIPAPSSDGNRPGLAPASPRHLRLLDLVRDAVDLELRLKATMTELDMELKEAGHSELPSVLMSLLRTHVPVTPPTTVPQAPKVETHPTVAKASPRPKNMGGAFKARILGLMSDKKEHRSKDIVKELKAKSPTTVYSLLSDLVREGHLIRTKYAHYRLKLRA